MTSGFCQLTLTQEETFRQVSPYSKRGPYDQDKRSVNSDEDSTDALLKFDIEAFNVDEEYEVIINNNRDTV